MRELLGLIPAAGRAARVAPLPCSKELFPVGFQAAAGSGARPKAVCLYLIERMRRAGVEKTFVVLREGKWDIPAYLGDGSPLGLSLAYLMTPPNGGPPFTLDRAFPFVREATVLFGFPDIIFQPEDAFVSLLSRLAAEGEDLVLASFPAHDPPNLDMIEIDEAGRVRALEIKPARTRLRHTWMAAAWTPAFTHFMHEHLSALGRVEEGGAGRTRGNVDLSVGHVIRAAIRSGLRAGAVAFEEGSYLDIGTPEGMSRAVRTFR